MTIRPMISADNAALAAVIRNILMETGAPKVGTAYADPTLDRLHEVYNQPKSAYFIVEEEGQLLGGAGIAPLEGGDGRTCELQKMYLIGTARGQGIGAQLMARCLDFARAQGFERCYLETLPYMKAAQTLYVRSGFAYLEAPLGATGHYSCDVWMLKPLV